MMLRAKQGFVLAEEVVRHSDEENLCGRSPLPRCAGSGFSDW